MRILSAALMSATLALAFLPVMSAPAADDDLHAEVLEWVFAPCMEVAAAVDVDGLDQESVDLGIGRRHIAQLMLASRDSAIRELTGKMNANAAWEERRAANPALLRMCLAQFSKR